MHPKPIKSNLREWASGINILWSQVISMYSQGWEPLHQSDVFSLEIKGD